MNMPSRHASDRHQQVIVMLNKCPEYRGFNSLVFGHRNTITVDSDDSGDVPEDEVSDDEPQAVRVVPKVTTSTKRVQVRRHHHQQRPRSEHDLSSSESASSADASPICSHRKTMTRDISTNVRTKDVNSGGTSSSSGCSSTPQSPYSSTHTPDEHSSPTRRRMKRTNSPSSRWSPASIKNVLRSLSLNALLLPESNTSSNTQTSKPAKNNKKILRQPIAYTYLKGLSGLPTQRIPLKQSARLQPLVPALQCYSPTNSYAVSAELCCLQRAAALKALCLDQ